MTAPLTDRIRRALQLIYDYFRANAKWAKVERLQRELFRQGDAFDLYAVVEDIPSEYLRRGWDRGGEVSLTLRGISVCAGSADDVESVLRLVRLAVERYKGPEEQPTITSDDLRAAELDDLALARVLVLGDSEAFILGGGGGSGSTWTRFISPEIRHFGQVETIDQYLATRDGVERKLRAATSPGFFADAAELIGGPQHAPTPPPTTLYVDQRLIELYELATTALKRLEAGDGLSAVLPSVHRLAREMGDLEVARWTTMEIEGFRSGIRPRSELQEAEVAGVRRFLRMRSVPEIERDPSGESRDAMAPRKQLLSHSIGELETIASIAGTAGSLRDLMALQETRRVLDTIRLETLTWVAGARNRVQADRAAIELLGPDALLTFEAGGAILEDLRRAVTSLRSGSVGNAALLARNSLIAMGQLYRGPEEYTSADGRPHRATGERNPLHALVEELSARVVDEERKRLLLAAHDAIDRAYKLGSKAKEPSAVTHAEATEAVTLTFRVAQAIALAAGFPLRSTRQARS